MRKETETFQRKELARMSAVQQEVAVRAALVEDCLAKLPIEAARFVLKFCPKVSLWL